MNAMKNKKRVKYDGAAPLPIVLYLLSIAAALMFTICRSQFLPCALVMSALTAGIFMLFYKLRFRPIATTLCIFAFILAAWLAGTAAASWSPAEDISFMNFLFSASASFEPIYAGAAILIFSLVIGFIGCYFSVLSPRPCFLMLLMFIPMILSSRTAREMPVYFMLIMTGCFVFASANLSIPCPISCPLEGEAFFEGKSSRRRRIAVSCAAAVVISLVAAVLPKSENTPFKDYLDSFVPKSSGFYGGGGLANFSNHSSVNTGANNPDDTLLFTVETDYPGLLKSWAFDIYNDSGWTLYRGKDEYDFETGHSNWQTAAHDSIPAEYVWALGNCGDEDGMSEDSLSLIEGINPRMPESVRTIIRVKDGSSTRVVMHPAGEYSVMLPESCGRTYRNPRGDIFTEFAFPVNASYMILHYAGGGSPKLLRRLDYDSFERLINDAYDAWVISGDTRDAVLDELEWAKKYRQATSGDIPEKIRELAGEITEGLESDYDKARAIERWFGEAGFVYDLAFVPEKPGAEYFLFESRRGICSDYAGAMTLLARAAGLPARYCEGYAVTPDTYDPETGLYNITGKQAHAYTQIYLPGGGWIDFDATQYAHEAEDGQGIPLWIYVLAGASVAAVLIFLIRKPLSWLIFNITYPLRGRSGRIRRVYFRARRLAAEVSGGEEKSLACGEVRRILSDCLGMPEEAGRICGAADKLFYSPEGTAEDAGLLKDLKALKKRRRRRK